MSDGIETKPLDPIAQALLDSQNKRIERIELQLDNLSQRVDAINENLSQRIDNLNQRIDTTNEKIDAVHSELSAKIDAVRSELSAKIDAVRSELSAKIDAVNGKADSISKDIQNLHKWFVTSAVTAVLGIGAIVASVIIKLFFP